MRILIAEDDLTSRYALTGVLKNLGYEVVTTVDGDAAWAALQESDAPQVAILDWMMPGIDGLEVIRRVRAVPSSRPPYIIMLTTKVDKDDVVAGLDAGANDYLTKPFDAAELRARIEVGRRMVEVQAELASTVEELRAALSQIRTLRGIVPICSSCKKIRDDQGYWKQVEEYVCAHTEAQFSHSICPKCMKRLYPDVDERHPDV